MSSVHCDINCTMFDSFNGCVSHTMYFTTFTISFNVMALLKELFERSFQKTALH